MKKYYPIDLSLKSRDYFFNSKIKFFDFFKPEDDLKKYKINQERYELHTNRGSLIVGSSKIEAWQKIVFSQKKNGCSGFVAIKFILLGKILRE